MFKIIVGNENYFKVSDILLLSDKQTHKYEKLYKLPYCIIYTCINGMAIICMGSVTFLYFWRVLNGYSILWHFWYSVCLKIRFIQYYLWEESTWWYLIISIYYMYFPCLVLNGLDWYMMGLLGILQAISVHACFVLNGVYRYMLGRAYNNTPLSV